MRGVYLVSIESDGSLRMYNKKGYEINNTVQETKRYAEMIIDHFKKHKAKYMSSILAISVTLFPSTSLAATASSSDIGGKGLIVLLQKASFWLGMGVTIWGIVEAMLDYPGWKGRIAKGVLGYIAILLIPLLFFELQNHLMSDVWKQIEGR